jgi:hypothetical protein
MSDDRIHGDEGYIPEEEREAAEDAIEGPAPPPSEEAEESERALAVGPDEPVDPDLIEVELEDDEFADEGGVP